MDSRGILLGSLLLLAVLLYAADSATTRTTTRAPWTWRTSTTTTTRSPWTWRTSTTTTTRTTARTTARATASTTTTSPTLSSDTTQNFTSFEVTTLGVCNDTRDCSALNQPCSGELLKDCCKFCLNFTSTLQYSTTNYSISNYSTETIVSVNVSSSVSTMTESPGTTQASNTTAGSGGATPAGCATAGPTITTPAGNITAGPTITTPAGNTTAGPTETTHAGSTTAGPTGTTPAGNTTAGLTGTTPAGNTTAGQTGTSPAGTTTAGLTGTTPAGTTTAGLTGTIPAGNTTARSTGSSPHAHTTTSTLITTSASKPCNDSGTLTCDFPRRFCYESISPAYSKLCCGTCQALANASLGSDCLYGDLSADCDARIIPGTVCSDAERKDCCETCQTALKAITTTEDTCRDQSEECGESVSNVSSNCYQLEGVCCRTCRPLIKARRPETCKYGNKINNCDKRFCGFLSDSCCETCFEELTTTTTTPAPTTTACLDTESNCAGKYSLVRTPNRCYTSPISKSCCGTCLELADRQKPSCLWGDKDIICSLSPALNCSNAATRDLCCDRCSFIPALESTATPPVTTTAVFIPSNCVDNFPQCTDLTEVASSCYNDSSSFVADSCCASCYRKIRPDLPSNCSYGDRLSYCSLIADLTSCQNDLKLQRDCCETCQERLRTTTAAPTTSCYNIYTDSTCLLLYTQLKGNCSSIRDKCCKTCSSAEETTLQSNTTTAVDLCKDELPSVVCQTIIAAEKTAADCYGGFLNSKCCASCKIHVTLETTTGFSTTSTTGISTTTRRLTTTTRRPTTTTPRRTTTRRVPRELTL